MRRSPSALAARDRRIEVDAGPAHRAGPAGTAGPRRPSSSRPVKSGSSPSCESEPSTARSAGRYLARTLPRPAPGVLARRRSSMSRGAGAEADDPGGVAAPVADVLDVAVLRPPSLSVEFSALDTSCIAISFFAGSSSPAPRPSDGYGGSRRGRGGRGRGGGGRGGGGRRRWAATTGRARQGQWQRTAPCRRPGPPRANNRARGPAW